MTGFLTGFDNSSSEGASHTLLFFLSSFVLLALIDSPGGLEGSERPVTGPTSLSLPSAGIALFSPFVSVPDVLPYLPCYLCHTLICPCCVVVVLFTSLIYQ